MKILNLIRYLRFIRYRINLHGKLQASGRNFIDSGVLKSSSDGIILIASENVIERNFDWEIIQGRLSIGARNYFNRNTKIVCLDSVSIGNDCLIADSVHIYDHDHCFNDVAKPIKYQGYITKPVKIGNNVWIGAKATILKGVTIGDGAIIGANAVVTRDVPANAIVAGNPGRIVRIRA